MITPLPEATPKPVPSSGPLTEHPFTFTGSGNEYFRIWIVNLLLSVLTLGVYSAWAKVRTTRYLYGNTHVAGDSFEYHAEPLAILKGRVIAIALLAAYVLSTQFMPLASTILAVLVAFAAPWVVVRALRFRAVMSSWRNVRFNFVGETGAAYGIYLFAPLLGVITLGLALPYVWYVQSQFVVDNHRLGKTMFGLGARVRNFYSLAAIVALVSFLVFFLVFGAFGLIAGMSGLFEDVADDPESGMTFIAVLVPMLIGYAVIFALYKGLRFRVVYNNLNLNENRLKNRMGIFRFIWISLTNSLGILLTLGLFYPWAKIRMTAFLVNSMSLHAADIDKFVNSEDMDTSALGEEVGEAFDFGFGV